MTGSGEPIAIEDPSPTMEDIFENLHLEDHQMSTSSPISTKVERSEPEMTAAKEVIIDRGQGGGTQVEGSLPEEHPTTEAVSRLPDVSSAPKYFIFVPD